MRLHRSGAAGAALVRRVPYAKLRTSGENTILDIQREELEDDLEDISRYDYDDDSSYGTGWLAAMAPLRADALALVEQRKVRRRCRKRILHWPPANLA